MRCDAAGSTAERDSAGEIVMANNYPEELGKWVKRRESSEPTTPVALFLAVRDDIEAAMDAGYPMKTIWQQMKDRQCLNVHYDTFRGYVKRYIFNTRNSTPVAGLSKSLSGLKKAKKPAAVRPTVKSSAATSASAIPGFTFNPNPKKEDLI
jgi:hypothetical protein